MRQSFDLASKRRGRGRSSSGSRMPRPDPHRALLRAQGCPTRAPSNPSMLDRDRPSHMTRCPQCRRAPLPPGRRRRTTRRPLVTEATPLVKDRVVVFAADGDAARALELSVAAVSL